MNRKLLASQVEEELMDYILQEPVNVGDKIPNEFELAEMFGVGRDVYKRQMWQSGSPGAAARFRETKSLVLSPEGAVCPSTGQIVSISSIFRSPSGAV